MLKDHNDSDFDYAFIIINLSLSISAIKLSPDFFVSSANYSKRYSNALPKMSVPSKSEFLSLGELKWDTSLRNLLSE